MSESANMHCSNYLNLHIENGSEDLEEVFEDLCDDLLSRMIDVLSDSGVENISVTNDISIVIGVD